MKKLNFQIAAEDKSGIINDPENGDQKQSTEGLFPVKRRRGRKPKVKEGEDDPEDV